MRSDYGKLVYLLQDTMDPAIKELLECDCIEPITSVHKYLADRKVRFQYSVTLLMMLAGGESASQRAHAGGHVGNHAGGQDTVH